MNTEKKIETLLTQLTLEEKATLLAGTDLWHTRAIERVGVPAMKVSDGPNGARGADDNAGPTSACFPVGSALGATWNTTLLEQVGAALAEEVQAKGARILLAPTVNLHRSPLAGRNFECYSEDPYLTGVLATAYIRGLQDQGVGACIKHFVCNDSEFERMSISSEVAERPLRELYLRPFEMALRDARPWTLMSAYNRVNGTYASEHDRLLRDILKGEWGFDGAVISDWYGTYSAAAAAGGLDLEMPGPGRWLVAEGVLAEVQAGKISEDVIDDKVRRLLRTLIRVGAFEQPQPQPEQAINRPEHRRLARQSAAEAIVLLKNENNLLPLAAEQLQSVAVIGENARWAQIMGGGSSAVNPHYVISPLDGIRAKANGRFPVHYTIGCLMHRSMPGLPAKWLHTPDGRPGLRLEYFDNHEFSGQPVHTATTTRTRLHWFGRPLAAGPVRLDPEQFAARLSGTITVPESGVYTLGLALVGQARLTLDGAPLLETASDPQRPEMTQEHMQQAVVELEAERPYTLQIDYVPFANNQWHALQFGSLPALPEDPLQAAVDLAAQSDVAIVVAGLTGEWESEGFDRVDMRLPGEQDELIWRVAAVNPNTIVVLNVGSPVEMPWLADVTAVLQLWYGGQEMGNALADVLFGDFNPSGRLPTTFPRRLADNPAYINYPGENGRVHYGEGLFIGYRYYDKKEIEPLFPFGFGLSYTQFDYANLALDVDAEGGTVRVSLDVTNSGARAGQEVVQLYLRDVEASLTRPLQELKAFAKVTLQPGETQRVSLTLDAQALAFYDPARPGWVVEPGEFEVRLGHSSRDIALQGQFHWPGAN